MKSSSFINLAELNEFCATQSAADCAMVALTKEVADADKKIEELEDSDNPSPINRKTFIVTTNNKSWMG